MGRTRHHVIVHVVATPLHEARRGGGRDAASDQRAIYLMLVAHLSDRPRADPPSRHPVHSRSLAMAFVSQLTGGQAALMSCRECSVTFYK